MSPIGAVHVTVFSRDAEATRAFFRDVLELDSVDAGGGWLISVAELRGKGVELVRPVTDEGFGRVGYLDVPGIGELGLYEPRHPTPPR